MDPITIAAGAVALLAPFVRQAGEEFAGEAGKVVWEKTRTLLSRLKTRLAGDRVAAQTVERFQRDPDIATDDMQSVLEERLASDPRLLKEIGELLAEVKQAGPQVTVVQRVKEAERLVGVEGGRLKQGRIDVTQESDRASDTTGVKLDEIG
jgi:hypothetical protein